MDIQHIQNFICSPKPSNNNVYVLTELQTCETFTIPGFVSIPYVNPQTNAIKIQYFSILSQQEITITAPKKSQQITLQSKTTKTQYIQNVIELKQQIQLGNIYEINYCLQFFNENVSINPMEVFSELQKISNAPYSYLIKIGSDYTICCSPELFLKKTNNVLSTKPIKGTTKRGLSEEEDLLLKMNLQNSLKERTENVMAVDVARNDLSVIAQKGSVHVNKLYNIESFETVHQMVSTISCEIKKETTFAKIIDATFPMASMTGAPKLSAMNWIDKIENFNRKNYSGTFGLVDEYGNFELPVIIRSIFYNQNTMHLSLAAGGAITYLSEADKEYDEIILKIQAQLKALNANIKDL